MPELTYLSLGWGVQSFTIAAMVAMGELPPIDVAVHADTTHESSGTYAHAEKWTPWLQERGVTVITVQAKNVEILHSNTGGKAQYSVYPPAFTQREVDGKKGQVKRQCTDNWKIRPINAYMRSLLPGGRTFPEAIECWQGISLDEWHRMKDSHVRYVVNRYPLVERRMTRAHCVAWLEEHGLDVPPKSACVFCPFHSRSHWRQLKRDGGIDWEYARAADAAIRDARQHEGFKLYLNDALVPLEEAIRIPEDYGARQLGLEEAPCDGGVCFG